MAGDDLRRKPWQPFEIDNHNYLLKSAFTEDSYEILCYDMTTLWYEKCDMKNLKKITKKLNPSVEMPLPRLLTHLESTIESQQDTVKYTVQKTDDDKLVVSMDSDLTKGVPFTWQFQCQTANAMLASHVTIPLLTMVTELQRRTEQLQRIIKTKDSEIEDYKLGGARVSRKHLETVPFDAKTFFKDMTKCKEFVSEVKAQGGSAFNKYGQTLYKSIMIKQAHLEENDGQESDKDSAATSRKSTPASSPRKPKPSPSKVTSLNPSPPKDSEQLRRQALEKRLADEEHKLQSKKKKKKGLF